MNANTKNMLAYLRAMICRSQRNGNGSGSSIIAYAQRIMSENPRKDLPDWVEIVANGNPQSLPSVLAVAYQDLQSEKKRNGSD